MSYLDQIREATEVLKGKTNYRPEIGIILGSGLGIYADTIEDSDKVPFSSVPHIAASTVEGHSGQFVIGRVGGKQIIAMQGRIHYYEGYTMREITFPIRIMQLLGVKKLIITSACGGLNSNLYVGALMIVKDHINLMGDNPLIGENHEELGPRFPDMSNAYNPELIALAHEAGKELDIKTESGIHAAVTGPYFYSNAETNMVRIFGADTIGMSMIPEVIVANHGGIKCLGIACVTDMEETEEQEEILTHDKVLEQAARVRPNFIKLIDRIINKM